MPRNSLLTTAAVLLGIGLVSASAWAEVYKCVDAQGRVTFSGSRCAENAQTVQIQGAAKPHAEEPSALEQGAAPAAPVRGEAGTAVVTLRNGSQPVRLITKSMYCYKGMTTYQGPRLVLPSGLRIPYAKIRRIKNDLSPDGSSVTMHVTMLNGKETAEKLTEPWLKIVGDNDFGRFAKPVNEISSIDFFP